MASDEHASRPIARALLDTSVLYSVVLCDLLLRLAEVGLYIAIWSDDIIEELLRNLNLRLDTERAERRVEAMMQSGVLSMTERQHYAELESSMTNHPSDRHALAAAVASNAATIVTLNSRHFPTDKLTPLGIAAETPDTFLVPFLEAAPEVVIDVIRGQVAAMTRPPVTVEHVLSRRIAIECAGVCSTCEGRDVHGVRTSALKMSHCQRLAHAHRKLI